MLTEVFSPHYPNKRGRCVIVLDWNYNSSCNQEARASCFFLVYEIYTNKSTRTRKASSYMHLNNRSLHYWQVAASTINTVRVWVPTVILLSLATSLMTDKKPSFSECPEETFTHFNSKEVAILIYTVSVIFWLWFLVFILVGFQRRDCDICEPEIRNQVRYPGWGAMR